MNALIGYLFAQFTYLNVWTVMGEEWMKLSGDDDRMLGGRIEVLNLKYC